MKELGTQLTNDQIYQQWRSMRQREGTFNRFRHIFYEAEMEIYRKWSDKQDNERDHVQCSNELRNLGIEGRNNAPAVVKKRLERKSFFKGLYSMEFRNDVNELAVLHQRNWVKIAKIMGQEGRNIQLRKLWDKQTEKEKVPSKWTSNENLILNTRLQAEEHKGYNQIDWKAIKAPLIGRSVGSIKRKIENAVWWKWFGDRNLELGQNCRQYTNGDQIDFDRVAAHFPDLTPLQCMLRFQHLTDQF